MTIVQDFSFENSNVIYVYIRVSREAELIGYIYIYMCVCVIADLKENKVFNLWSMLWVFYFRRSWYIISFFEGDRWKVHIGNDIYNAGATRVVRVND